MANDLFGDLPEDGMEEEFEALRSALAEALAAFQQAKESGTLSPELKTFVERRLQQLSH